MSNLLSRLSINWIHNIRWIIMVDPNAKKLFWFLFAGSRGGMNRISIIELLIEQPYNINQLSDIIKIDYKAIQHHIHVLEKNNLITKDGEKYGILYFISNYLEANMAAFREVIDKIQKSKRK
jgi:predicted transcriptional regulator